MGNSIIGRGSKKAKIMKINGETFKLKTPILAFDVVKDYPGHVLLESEAVKRFGIRAKPLEPQEELKPKKIYFLVELPKLLPEERVSKRARFAAHMSAKDRLESLMLSRRPGFDVPMERSECIKASRFSITGENSIGSRPVRVKMRLPRSQLEKLMKVSKDETELAEKIHDFCIRS